MSYACHICNVEPQDGNHDRQSMYCIGRIKDLCIPTDELYITRQRAENQPCCNYAESLDAQFKADDSRVGIFTSTFMLSYGSSQIVRGPEHYFRIRWAARGNRHKPCIADRADLMVRDGEGGEALSPCPLVFMICSRCGRLARNYLSHRYLDKPRSERGNLHGFDLLYEAMVKRFVRDNKDVAHPQSLYPRSDSDEVEMLGRAVVVQSNTRSGPPSDLFKDCPDIFTQIPSLPMWIRKKLRKLESKEAPSHVEPPAVPSCRMQSQNPLLDLPTELLYEITGYLDDRQSLMAVRLVHPKLAALVTLPQAFWYKEMLFGSPPLFGFEPLLDTQQPKPSLHIGGIDAFSQVATHFTMPATVRKDPGMQIKPVVNAKPWAEYDWKGLARLLLQVKEFEEGGQCSDAPRAFIKRRQLWWVIHQLVDGSQDLDYL